MGGELNVTGAARASEPFVPVAEFTPDAARALAAQFLDELTGGDSGAAFRARHLFDAGGLHRHGLAARFAAATTARAAAPPRPPIDDTTYSTPNYGNSRHGADIDTIILHHTGTGKKGSGSLAATTSHFANPSSKVSAHYVIDRDGKIYQLVGDEKRSWHAGRGSLRGDGKDLNDRSIGIEIVNDGSGSTPFTEAQYRALEQLVPHLAARHGVPARNVVGHKDVSSQGKPDPATNFDMGRVLRSLDNAPDPTPQPTQPQPTQPTAPRPAPARPTTPAPDSSNAPAHAAPAADLRRGQRNADVLRLQAALVRTGHLTLEQVRTGPGTFGPQTFAAVQKFQREHGVPDTGFYGPLTRAALDRALSHAPAAPTRELERGDRGADVLALQAALVKTGHLTLAEVQTGPGTFGPRTFGAVRDFQREHGVPQTGYYGPLTRSALGRALGGGRETPPAGNEPAAPTRPTTPAVPQPTAEAARNVDRILRGTGLEGKGELMVRLAKKYDVPVELALAMFRKEASFNQFGSAPLNNNPGNIRFVGQEGATRGAGGFARWATLDQGVEAYFKLLDGPRYRGFVDRRDWAGLINVYAPSSENNTAQYVRQVTEWAGEYRRAVYGAARPQAPEGSGQTGGVNNGAATTIRPYTIYTGSRHIRRYEDLPPHHDYQRTARGEVRDFTLVRPGQPNAGHAVPSPMRGVVTRAAWIGGYGNAVEVQNPRTGEKFLIGHMQRLNVRVGDSVEYGQTIGAQGSTGNSSGPHIHIEAPSHIVRRYITDLLDGRFERTGRDYAGR